MDKIREFIRENFNRQKNNECKKIKNVADRNYHAEIKHNCLIYMKIHLERLNGNKGSTFEQLLAKEANMIVVSPNMHLPHWTRQMANTLTMRERKQGWRIFRNHEWDHGYGVVVQVLTRSFQPVVWSPIILKKINPSRYELAPFSIMNTKYYMSYAQYIYLSEQKKNIELEFVMDVPVTAREEIHVQLYVWYNLLPFVLFDKFFDQNHAMHTTTLPLQYRHKFIEILTDRATQKVKHLNAAHEELYRSQEREKTVALVKEIDKIIDDYLNGARLMKSTMYNMSMAYICGEMATHMLRITDTYDTIDLHVFQTNINRDVETALQYFRDIPHNQDIWKKEEYSTFGSEGHKCRRKTNRNSTTYSLQKNVYNQVIGEINTLCRKKITFRPLRIIVNDLNHREPANLKFDILNCFDVNLSKSAISLENQAMFSYYPENYERAQRADKGIFMCRDTHICHLGYHHDINISTSKHNHIDSINKELQQKYEKRLTAYGRTVSSSVPTLRELAFHATYFTLACSALTRDARYHHRQWADQFLDPGHFHCCFNCLL